MQERKCTVCGSGTMVKLYKDTFPDGLFPTGASQARARNAWRLILCQSLVSKFKTINLGMKHILRTSKERLQIDLQTV